MSHFFLPSVFVASLRPENMAAGLYGCGGQSQTKCQLGHIVVGIKSPQWNGLCPAKVHSGTIWTRQMELHSKRRRTRG